MTLALTGGIAPAGAMATAFTPIGPAAGAAVGGNKEGGLAWGDLDADGCVDLLVNTLSSSLDSRLLRNDCVAGSHGFTDATGALASGLTDANAARSALWGDLDNDGHADLVRTGARSGDRIEVWLNRGPDASPPHSLGTPTQQPSHVVPTPSGGYNPEGAALVDFDADGWLDIAFQNEGGIDLLRNPADGTAAFTHATPDASPRGLPTGGTIGDYMAAGDVDRDGDVDLLARLDAHPDLWLNGGGTFTAAGTGDDVAPEDDKGGVALCDLDADGDLDIARAGAGTVQNRVWMRGDDGGYRHDLVPVTVPGVVRDAACGDVDNDGDLDLLFVRDGPDVLFENRPAGGVPVFVEVDAGIAGNATGSAAAFADHDRDGDLDVAINQDDANELWRNDTDDDRYLFVRALRALPGGLARDDIGATVRLETCDAEPASGLREVNGGQGRGSQGTAGVHFGLPDGPEAVVVVHVRFVGGTDVRRAVVPSELGAYHETSVRSDAADDLAACGRRPPRITWTDPGPALAGAVGLHVDVEDGGVGVAEVSFERRSAGGTAWQPIATLTSPPWRTTWSTADVPDARYEMRASMRDRFGRVRTSDLGERVVDNTPPSVSLGAVDRLPAGGVTLQAAAADAGSGVASVGFEAAPTPDGPWARLGVDATPPFTTRWDARPGAHFLRVVGLDRAGNTATDGPVRVVVEAPGARESAAVATCAPRARARPSRHPGRVELSARQLRIDQRVASAALRRAAAIERWLDSGIEARDICPGALGPTKLAPGAVSWTTDPVARGTDARPRPLPRTARAARARSTVRLSVRQLRINQSIAAAAVRRANAAAARLDGGLGGRDVRDGALTADRLSASVAPGTTEGGPVPAPRHRDEGVTPPRKAVAFRLTRGQLVTNQRISVAAIRRLQRLEDRIRTGLDERNFRDGSITRADLAPPLGPRIG